MGSTQEMSPASTGISNTIIVTILLSSLPVSNCRINYLVFIYYTVSWLRCYTQRVSQISLIDLWRRQEVHSLAVGLDGEWASGSQGFPTMYVSPSTSPSIQTHLYPSPLYFCGLQALAHLLPFPLPQISSYPFYMYTHTYKAFWNCSGFCSYC